MPEGELQEPGSKASVLEEENMKRFIERTGIDPKDFSLLEKLAQFPSDLIIEHLHNIFNMCHERAGQEIERNISFFEKAKISGRKVPHSEQALELLGLMLQLARKYDWPVCYGLVRILEERRIPWQRKDWLS